MRLRAMVLVLCLAAALWLTPSCSCGGDDDDDDEGDDDGAPSDDDSDDDTTGADDDDDDDVDDDASDDDTGDDDTGLEEIFSDDFEQYVADQPPVPTWQIFTDDGDIVVTDAFPVKQEGQFAFLTKDTAAPDPTLMRAFFEKTAADSFYAAFDLWTDGNIGAAVEIYAFSEPTISETAMVYQLSWSSSDGVFAIDYNYTGPGSYQSSPCPYATPNAWHAVEVWLDFATHSSTTAVDGLECGAGIPFMNERDDAASIWFQRVTATPPGWLGVDNVWVGVPAGR